MEKRKLWIVCPCFFDTVSFLLVREEARRTMTPLLPSVDIGFLVVDDSAGQDPGIASLTNLPDVQISVPPYNLGHQGALVFALRGLGPQVKDDDFIITMDSDGEDRPEDLGTLIGPLLSKANNLHQISIARRTRRTESLYFKLFYICFKLVFRTLTGTIIRNGNFAAYRGWLLKEVIFHPHFDQCYSSSFISLPMQIELAPLPRGRRFAGRSKMGYTGLVTHGIRMLMPFSEKIATRGIVASAVLVGVSLFTLIICATFGHAVWLPLFGIAYGTLTLGISVLLFATFSQTKARSLRGLNDLTRS